MDDDKTKHICFNMYSFMSRLVAYNCKSDIRISSLYWLKFIIENKASDLTVGTLAGVLAGFFSRNHFE